MHHRNILRFVDEHTEAGQEKCLIRYDSNSFLTNSTLYAQFSGMKKNSYNRNLRQHGFAIDSGCDVAAELGIRFPMIMTSARSLVKRVCMFGQFNGQSSDEEIGIATDHACQVQSRRVTPELPRPHQTLPLCHHCHDHHRHSRHKRWQLEMEPESKQMLILIKK
jgi:hypothetical protein